MARKRTKNEDAQCVRASMDDLHSAALNYGLASLANSGDRGKAVEKRARKRLEASAREYSRMILELMDTTV